MLFLFPRNPFLKMELRMNQLRENKDKKYQKLEVMIMFSILRSELVLCFRVTDQFVTEVTHRIRILTCDFYWVVLLLLACCSVRQYLLYRRNLSCRSFGLGQQYASFPFHFLDQCVLCCFYRVCSASVGSVGCLRLATTATLNNLKIAPTLQTT